MLPYLRRPVGWQCELYETETKAFNQAVKRNMERFSKEFMFQLTAAEWQNMWSQFVTTSTHLQQRRRKDNMPFAFTEHGVAMLAAY